MRTDGPVVIALDGSPHSALTLEWGLLEARLREAPAVLTRAYREPPDSALWAWYPVADDLRFDTEAKEYLAARLEDAAGRHPGLSLTTRVLHGPEVPELQALSDEAQLLVVGARGHAGPGRIGPVSGHLAAHARCPVLVVRADAPDAHGPAAPVVVGVDGSPTSLVAARLAAREAVLRGVPLVVAHARPIVPNPYARGVLSLPPLATADEDDPTHRAARGVADGLRAEHPGLEVRTELMDDDPVHALVELSREAPLVVVGSRGLGGFRGMLLGSVSTELVREAAGTVLVVHDPGE